MSASMLQRKRNVSRPGDEPAGASSTSVSHGLSPDNVSNPTQSLVARQNPSQQKRDLSRLVVCLSGVIALVLGFLQYGFSVVSLEPKTDLQDYGKRTAKLLSTTPLIDGHNDLPYLIRVELKNAIYNDRFTFEKGLLSHTDLQKMRQGRMGGQFWSVYMHCSQAEHIKIDDPTWYVRDALEQIDIAKRFIEKYPTAFQFCDNPLCVRKAFKAGKISGMLGVEGGHLVGNSLAAIRQMHSLGVRYLTTTHNCDNAFGTSWISVKDGGEDAGLSSFGKEYVKEMNRLGMMIDLSHVSQKTMRDGLLLSKAPVIFSHSSAYTVSNHLRNVPDDVLHSLKQNGGIVMVNFVNYFIRKEEPEKATIHDVVDHIMHIVSITGWDHIGLGSDFDGTSHMPIGLEDVSKYPHLIALIMQRGATDEQIRSLVGENILRVWSEVENVGKKIRFSGELPNEETWEGREWSAFGDLPRMFRDSRG
ncbi:putative dipeptidase [Xylogone sp. PMI_703]|nr:putative dipeptidase [Xylogone sp. PMI_703]